MEERKGWKKDEKASWGRKGFFEGLRDYRRRKEGLI